jgi:hypothetical protein
MLTEAQFTEAQELAYKAGLVRFHQGHKVIGAGFYVNHRYVLTCAHVVTQCLNLGKNPQGIAVEAVAGQSIPLDFPFVPQGQLQKAEIVPILWRLNHQDLAVLRVLEALPAGVAASPIQESTYYRGDRYHVYGFPEGHPNGVESRGELLSEQAGGWIQMEDTKAEGVPIEPGFSGAPVWDARLGTIAGMTVARDQDREGAKVSFMIPYPKLKPALEAIALFELLLPEANNLTPHWQTAYRLLRPEIATASYPTTLQQAIVQVQAMSAQGSEYRPIDQFVGYLALPELGQLIQPRLLDWLREQVAGKVEDLLEKVRQKAAVHRAQQPQTLAPHLLFWVQAELNSDRYSVQAYLVNDREQYDPLNASQLAAPAAFLEKSGDGKVEQAEIEKVLRACLDESGQRLEDIRNLKLEIFLPLRHLAWEIDQWAVADVPEPDLMGYRYQVIVRLADRWQQGYIQYRGDWNDKWAMLQQLQDSQGCQGLICADGKTPKQLRKELRQPDNIGILLTQAPPTYAEDVPSPFTALLQTGSPIAIWLRQNLPEIDCRQQLHQVYQYCLSQLPERVKSWREEGDLCDEGEAHIGQNLGLIWEDPRLVPPGAVQAGAIPSRLRMPA